MTGAAAETEREAVETETETETIKRALRALALGEPRERREPAADEAVVAEAAAALDDVAAAAAFRDRGGFDRLEAAVERAATRGDEALARRGRRALAAVERYRRAADSPPSAASPSVADHFHPGHGTPLSDAGQSGDR